MSVQPSPPLSTDQYATMEAVILSDQLSSAQLAALLRDDPAFEHWIRNRGTARHGIAVTSQNGRTESPDQLVTTTEA